MICNGSTNGHTNSKRRGTFDRGLKPRAWEDNDLGSDDDDGWSPPPKQDLPFAGEPFGDDDDDDDDDADDDDADDDDAAAPKTKPVSLKRLSDSELQSLLCAILRSPETQETAFDEFSKVAYKKQLSWDLFRHHLDETQEVLYLSAAKLHHEGQRPSDPDWLDRLREKALACREIEINLVEEIEVKDALDDLEAAKVVSVSRGTELLQKQLRLLAREAFDRANAAEIAKAAETLQRRMREIESLAEPQGPINFADLQAAHPEMRPPIIDGLLRSGETMSVNAKTKVGKSWLAYSMALALASGTEWLSKFPCEQGRVLIIDNELHPETLSDRIPRVAEALGLSDAEWKSRLDVLMLRGRLQDIHQLRGLFDSIVGKGYKLILIDAIYRALPTGTAENANEGIAAVMNAVDSYASATGAAIVFVHHATKGNQADKDVTDVGAGAGAFARAVDCHLVIRPHEEPDCVVLDAALRSFAPVDPCVLRWQHPIWSPTEAENPEALAGKKSKHQMQQEKRDAQGMAKVKEALAAKGPLTNSKLRQETGLSKGRLDRLRNMMIAEGEIIIDDTASTPQYRLAPQCLPPVDPELDEELKQSAEEEGEDSSAEDE